MGVERKVGGKLRLKLKICLRPIANTYFEGKTQRTLKRELQVPEIVVRGSELHQFCLVRLAHGAGIHVSVCVVACLDCQNQFTCQLDLLRRSHSLSVCSHILGFTNGLCSNAKLLK